MLKSFILWLLYPYLTRYYSVKIAKTENEKIAVFKFRYKIYRNELSHYFLDDKLISCDDMLYDHHDFSENTVIVYSGTKDKITGTMRFTNWRKSELPEVIKNKYFIDEKIFSAIEGVGELRFFQIDKAYRKSPLAVILFCRMYKSVVEKKSRYPELIFCDAQPGLLPYYLQMGSFNYTDKVIYEEFGILQLPLAFAEFDLRYLKKARSIIYYFAKQCFREYCKTVGKEISSRASQDFEKIIPHKNMYLSKDKILEYRNNINDKFFLNRYDIITSILNEVLLLTLDAGTVIIKDGIVDYDVYLLVEGVAGVYRNGALLAELQPGAIFGEMALFNKVHKRLTDVEALTTVKIIMVPRNLLFQLEKKNTKSALQLLHILCQGLSEKLASSNAKLNEMIKFD